VTIGEYLPSLGVELRKSLGQERLRDVVLVEAR
jgi:hypothetical protein